MKAIVKQTLVFERTDPDAPSGAPTVFRTRPDTMPVELPEWLAETDLYKLAVKDGTIVETGSISTAGAPTAQQLALVSDADLQAEVDRRGNVAKQAVLDKQNAPVVESGQPATSGVSQQVKDADKIKQDAENKAAAVNPDPNAVVAVPAAKTGDSKTSRA